MVMTETVGAIAVACGRILMAFRESSRPACVCVCAIREICGFWGMQVCATEDKR